MAVRAALRFKLHTGWAMLVALAGQPGEIQVLFRVRIELLHLTSQSLASCITRRPNCLFRKRRYS